MLSHPPAINKLTVTLAGVENLSSSLALLGTSVSLNETPSNLPDEIINYHSLKIPLTAQRYVQGVAPNSSATIAIATKYDAHTRVAHGYFPSDAIKATKEFTQEIQGLNTLDIEFNQDNEANEKKSAYMKQMLNRLIAGYAETGFMLQQSLNKGILAEILQTFKSYAIDSSFAKVLDVYRRSIEENAANNRSVVNCEQFNNQIYDLALAYIDNTLKDIFIFTKRPGEFLNNFIDRALSTSTFYNYDNNTSYKIGRYPIGGTVFLPEDVYSAVIKTSKFDIIDIQKPIHYQPYKFTIQNGTHRLETIRDYENDDLPQSVFTKNDGATLVNETNVVNQINKIIHLSNLGEKVINTTDQESSESLPYREHGDYILGTVHIKKNVPYVIYQGKAFPIEKIAESLIEANLFSKTNTLCFVRSGIINPKSPALHNWSTTTVNDSVRLRNMNNEFFYPEITVHTSYLNHTSLKFGLHEQIIAFLNPYYHMKEEHETALNNMVRLSQQIDNIPDMWIKHFFKDKLERAENYMDLMDTYYANKDIHGNPMGDSGKDSLTKLKSIELSPFYSVQRKKNEADDDVIDQFALHRRVTMASCPCYVIPMVVRELRGNILLSNLGDINKRDQLEDICKQITTILYSKDNVALIFQDTLTGENLFKYNELAVNTKVTTQAAQLPVADGNQKADLQGHLKAITLSLMTAFDNLFGNITPKENLSFLYKHRELVQFYFMAYVVMPVLSRGKVIITERYVHDNQDQKETLENNARPPMIVKVMEIKLGYDFEHDSSVTDSVIENNTIQITQDHNGSALLRMCMLTMDFMYTTPKSLYVMIQRGIHPGFEIHFVKKEQLLSNDALFVRPLAVDTIMSTGIMSIKQNTDEGISFSAACNMRTANNSFTTGTMIAKNIHPSPKIGSVDYDTTNKPKISGDLITRSQSNSLEGVLDKLRHTTYYNMTNDTPGHIKDKDIELIQKVYGQNVVISKGIRGTFPGGISGINYTDDCYVPIIGIVNSDEKLYNHYPVTGIPTCSAWRGNFDKTIFNTYYNELSPLTSVNPYSSNLGGINQMLFTPSGILLGQSFMLESLCHTNPYTDVSPTYALLEEVFDISRSGGRQLTNQEQGLIDNTIGIQRGFGGDNVQLVSVPLESQRDKNSNEEDDITLRCGVMIPYTQYTSQYAYEQLHKKQKYIGPGPTDFAILSPFAV